MRVKRQENLLWEYDRQVTSFLVRLIYRIGTLQGRFRWTLFNIHLKFQLFSRFIV
jgi:hypothetical protein